MHMNHCAISFFQSLFDVIYPIFREPHHEIAASHRRERHRSGVAPSEAHLDRLTGVKTTAVPTKMVG